MVPMFGLGRKKDKDAKGTVESRRDGEEPSRRSLFGRLKAGLARTRKGLFGGLGDLLRGGRIDDEVLEEIEMHLLGADVGVEATRAIIEDLTARLGRRELRDSEALFAALREDMLKILEPVSHPLELDRPQGQRPFVILMVGVNGVGKTTTIGKVGKRLSDGGCHILMAAGDTFRAAAAEQLQTWAERCGAEFIRGDEGADPSSVIFDGVQAAAARGVDLVLADTAGRLHTKVNLMEELRKVRRVADRDPGHVVETLLVIDATTGQNGLQQARQFTEAVDVTGVVLTKLDGSAKGGIVFAIQRELGIPVKLVGLGEQAEDLIDFDSDEFVEGLLATD